MNSMTKGSLVQGRVLVYENIHCALWKSRTSNVPTWLEEQTEKNQYEMNFDMSRTLLKIWQTIDVSGMWLYRVTDVIKHYNASGLLDNIQVFVQKTTNDTN